MSITVHPQIEADGTHRYDADSGAAVRVMLQRRNGTTKCPIELLYKNRVVLSTDSNLRDLREIETLHKHAGTLEKSVNWHEFLTAVAQRHRALARDARPHVPHPARWCYRHRASQGWLAR